MNRLSMSAAFKVWTLWDAEIRPYHAHDDGQPIEHMRTLVEPLNVRVPLDARPYCHGIGEIDFYDKTGNKLLVRTSGHDMSSVHPQILATRNGGYWEIVQCGTVQVVDGEWCIVRALSNATRIAKMLNEATVPIDPQPTGGTPSPG